MFKALEGGTGLVISARHKISIYLDYEWLFSKDVEGKVHGLSEGCIKESACKGRRKAHTKEKTADLRSRQRPPEHEAGTVRVEVTWKSYFINYLKWFQHGGRMNFKGISKMVQ